MSSKSISISEPEPGAEAGAGSRAGAEAGAGPRAGSCDRYTPIFEPKVAAMYGDQDQEEQDSGEGEAQLL